MEDTVILDKAEFERVVNEISELRAENKELKKANKFLNDQIKEYNQRFTDANK